MACRSAGPRPQTAFRSTNLIAGGSYGIFAGEAESLQIYLNVIGSNAVGCGNDSIGGGDLQPCARR